MEVHIGQNIQNARKRAGLTQEELAERAQIAARVLQRIESAKANPKIGTLDGIARALGVPLADLVSPVVANRKIRDISGMAAISQFLAALSEAPPLLRAFVFALVLRDTGFLDAVASPQVTQSPESEAFVKTARRLLKQIA